MRDELELTYSLFSLRNGRRFFFSLSLLFMIWISQHFIRVLGGARGLLGWHFLAPSSPLSSPFAHTPLWYSFPLLPQGRQATKLIVSPPVYACASPRAAPTRRACVFPKLGEGRERGGGTAGWRASWGSFLQRTTGLYL